MENQGKVFATLSDSELCDDCLSVASGVRPRQQVNIICRSLYQANAVHRHHDKCDHCHKAKLVNRLPEKHVPKKRSCGDQADDGKRGDRNDGLVLGG